MGDWNEDDHPREGGKFTAKGGGAHVANTARAAEQAKEHVEKASKHRSAAKARRKAAEKEKDPVRRSEHLARAGHHDDRAKHHEGKAGSHSKGKKKEGGLAEWAAKRLEGAKEGVAKAGEKLNAVNDKVLEAKEFR